MKISLIVSTYNRPDALAAELDSLLVQRRLPDEIIIGDDGSRDETRRTIEAWAAKFPPPTVVRHIWHEDKGFRVGMMRNKCVAAATGDYIVQIDGDLLLHPQFIADHEAFARRGCYLKGGRVCLNERLTAAICAEGRTRPIRFWTAGLSRRENTLRMPWVAHALASIYGQRRSASLGANMSFWRDDFLAVNGYDEHFEGWGGEDDDLALRLQRYGVRKRSLKFAALGYHLWHGHNHMYNLDRNRRYLEEVNRRGDWRCADGVDKWL